MKLTQSLFIVNPIWFAVILIFQQLFDLGSTIYLTSTLNGIEANPLLAPMWDVTGGVWWLVSLKLWMCFALTTSFLAWYKTHPEVVVFAKATFVIYLLVMLWNGALVVSTMI